MNKTCQHCGTDNRFKTSTNCVNCGAPLPPIVQYRETPFGSYAYTIASTCVPNYMTASSVAHCHNDPYMARKQW